MLPPGHVENTGSAARDYCMLERNLLSHLKLALLLSLLSSSIILRARLVPEPDDASGTQQSSNIPLAVVQFAAALAIVGAGVMEYYRGCQDLRSMRAFLVAAKSVPTNFETNSPLSSLFPGRICPL